MYKLGVDLGGTNIAVGLVDDKDMKLITKKSTPTGAHREGEEIVADIATLCLEVCGNAGIALNDIAGIGIASPGIACNETGVVKYANNLKFYNFPIAAILAEKLGVKNIPIHIGNDANAAALGESAAGAAKGSRDSVMITLGTGVGGGIISDGKIISGFNDAGGELGHIVIEYNGVPCTCGRCGCWESYSSATALIRMTKEKIEECKREGRNSLMLSAEKVTGRTACDAWRAGDEAATEVYEKYIGYLACGLTNIINIFQPEVISLGGGISGEGESLIDSLTPLINKYAYGGNIVRHAQLKIAELGNDAGIIGAALL